MLRFGYRPRFAAMASSTAQNSGFFPKPMGPAMATAVSGTGPTYVFLVMEALIDAAVHLGVIIAGRGKGNHYLIKLKPLGEVRCRDDNATSERCTINGEQVHVCCTQHTKEKL